MALYFRGDHAHCITGYSILLKIYYLISILTAVCSLRTYALVTPVFHRTNVQKVKRLVLLIAGLLTVNCLMLLFFKSGPFFLAMISPVLVVLSCTILCVGMSVRKERFVLKKYQERFEDAFNFLGMTVIILFFYLAVSVFGYDQNLGKPVKLADTAEVVILGMIFVTLFCGLGAMAFTITLSSPLLCSSVETDNFYILKCIDVCFTILLMFTAHFVLYTQLQLLVLYAHIPAMHTRQVVVIRESIKKAINKNYQPGPKYKYNATTKPLNCDLVLFIALPVLLVLWKASKWSIENNKYLTFFIGLAIVSEISRRMMTISPNNEPAIVHSLKGIRSCSILFCILAILSLLRPTAFDSILSVLEPWYKYLNVNQILDPDFFI